MSTEDSTSIEAMLLSDDYWSGPVLEPIEAMSTEERGQYRRDARTIYADREKAQEIGNIVLSLEGGGSVRRIAEGEALPFPSDNPRQVVKIVEDNRMTIPRFGPKPPEYRLLKKVNRAMNQLAEEDDSCDFENIAKLMSTPTSAYTWLSAISIVKRSRDLLIVQREVGYVRAGHGGLGAVLKSHCLYNDEVHEKALVTSVLPFAVGATYREGRNSISKIASATLIEAKGVRWTHGQRGSANKQQKQRKLGWLPSFQASS